MQSVILVVHLMIVLALIVVVLLQRSEGGGLGMGGGGGGGSGVMSGRQAANALSKLTWIFAAAFIATSVTLTVLAARDASSGSVVDQFNSSSQGADAPAVPALPEIELPPPSSDAPAAPPAAD